MKKLLSIAVPTYNRQKSFSALHEDFLMKVSCFDQVEVLVCDNSDEEIARVNRDVVSKSSVNYYKNDKNLGFSGNIMECLGKAEGEFVWIISDDDETDYESFVEFLNWFEKLDRKCLNAVMIPFLNGDKNGEKYLMNTMGDWACSSRTSIKVLVESSMKIPFVLFSGVIVRNNDEQQQNIRDIFKQFKDNDYVQVPLFLSIIGKSGNIDFYNKPLQSYKPAYEGRFSLMGLVESMDDIIKFVGEFAGLKDEQMCDLSYGCGYSRWMQWIVLHKSGQVVIQEADDAIPKLLWKWRYQHLSSVRNFIRFMFCLSPKPVAKFLYEIKNKR